MKNDYTNGLVLKTINLIFKYLSKTYKNDKICKEMHNASASTGMPFMNVFLGINHVLVHKFELECHITHRYSNVIIMLYMILYNTMFPKSEHDLPADTVEEGM
ncbi:hypothetical protein [Bacillus cereus]|uniref:hypothetical protein n=1 Tax=Bacillus cereus TaxID=1396 RepID=UPI003F5AE0A7